MVEILMYVGVGLVIVVLEIQYRVAKIKLERLESLWVQVADVRTGGVVFDHSVKMLEELSKFDPPKWLFSWLVLKIYRKGEDD
ncbi:MAG: hypothetical protein KKF27_20645 [Gammaproteobacteria bacterium]|nr:hypothetical protein [Gammaproteobacteria bacterium]MBU2685658.1 hypothetical protein [Gammaproteobacteria bacterium]